MPSYIVIKFIANEKTELLLFSSVWLHAQISAADAGKGSGKTAVQENVP